MLETMAFRNIKEGARWGFRNLYMRYVQLIGTILCCWAENHESCQKSRQGKKKTAAENSGWAESQKNPSEGRTCYQAVFAEGKQWRGESYTAKLPWHLTFVLLCLPLRGTTDDGYSVSTVLCGLKTRPGRVIPVDVQSDLA